MVCSNSLLVGPPPRRRCAAWPPPACLPVAYLHAQYLVGLGLDHANVRQLLLRNSSLLMLPQLPAHVGGRLAWLTGTVGLDAQQALRVVAECPDVLALPLPNLTRK